MDLSAALEWLNVAVMNTVGHSLREPEVVILKGTWRGLTYEQMATGSDYSTNYLMRDVAPKLWRQLSSVFDRSVGKTNFRVALEAYAAAHSDDIDLNPSAALPDSSATKKSTGTDLRSKVRSGDLDANLQWHSSVLPRQGARDTVRRTRRPALSASAMYGYEAELDRVRRWIGETAEGQVVGLWGLKGVGKTLLAENIVAQMGDRFDSVVWRSLQNQPRLEDLCADILASLGIEASLQASAQLLTLMTQRSLLIVLEGLEAILQSGAPAGSYAPNYQAYSDFFQAIPSSYSCVVLTGIEGPTELTDYSRYASCQEHDLQGSYRQNPYQPINHQPVNHQPINHQPSPSYQPSTYQPSTYQPSTYQSSTYQPNPNQPKQYPSDTAYRSLHKGIRSLVLTRLSEAAAKQLLRAELESPSASMAADSREIGFPEDFSIVAGAIIEKPPALSSSIDSTHWPELISRYQGHPLALKSACRVIRDLFNGQVETFLQQTSLLSTDVLRLLAPSFERLTEPEKRVLYWLASQSAPLSLSELQQIPLPLSAGELISILDSLMQRSLLKIESPKIESSKIKSSKIESSKIESPEHKDDKQAHQILSEQSRNRPDSSVESSPLFLLSPLVKAYALRQFVNCFADSSLTSHTGQSIWDDFAANTEQVIDLSPSTAAPVQISQWFTGQFESAWHPLNTLFAGAQNSAARLRGVYHLQDETLIKRCKVIDLSAEPDTGDQHIRVALIVAIHREAESRYKLCVQAQPNKQARTLPAHLTLKLLDERQNAVAAVSVETEDAFLQLPYFRGTFSDAFFIELALGDRTHLEPFII